MAALTAGLRLLPGRVFPGRAQDFSGWRPRCRSRDPTTGPARMPYLSSDRFALWMAFQRLRSAPRAPNSSRQVL